MGNILVLILTNLEKITATLRYTGNAISKLKTILGN